MEDPTGSTHSLSTLTRSPLQERVVQRARISLSTYFPPETIYFYAFPSGEDSNFYNGVSPWIEELVAARALVCTGTDSDVKVLVFAPTLLPETRNLLQDEIGLCLLPQNHTLSLSSSIHSGLFGKERNESIRLALRNLIPLRSLVMAQPYLGAEMDLLAQIPPKLTNWLNNKTHLPEYVSSAYLPHVYKTYADGKEFAVDDCVISLPCVVKVSSSSSGDGVRVCLNLESLQKAKKDFASIGGAIHIEEYIPATHNICVQFGIPWQKDQPIEIIGYNEQLISERGEFLGGVVDPSQRVPFFQEISSVLLTSILPRVREMGWYGVGGFDVLIGPNGKFYFIDPNFRMTATFAHVLLSRNEMIRKPIANFIGTYTGTIDEFRKEMLPCSREGSSDQILKVISLTKEHDTFRFSAGLLFDNAESRRENAERLLRLGVQSTVLTNLAN